MYEGKVYFLIDCGGKSGSIDDLFGGHIHTIKLNKKETILVRIIQDNASIQYVD